MFKSKKLFQDLTFYAFGNRKHIFVGFCNVVYDLCVCLRNLSSFLLVSALERN